jgi:arsenate reductase (glutaredoxin)
MLAESTGEESMESVVIYHNPGCGSSRGALGLLNERGTKLEVIEYLKKPPARADLERILKILDSPPADLVRKDKRFKELGLNPDDYVDAKSVIAILLKHPELMQRPIVIRGGRALIARPPEKLNELF